MVSMAFLRSFDIAGSALTAQWLRMDVISQNIANANSTQNANGTGPYRRRIAVLSSKDNSQPFSAYLRKSQKNLAGGVRVSRIVEDNSPYKLVYDPSHPDADENGMVRLPNVDILTEMVDMMAATRAYDANVTVLNNMKTMALRALDLGR